jgi:hypothetical protein
MPREKKEIAAVTSTKKNDALFLGGGFWMPPQGPPAVARVDLSELPQNTSLGYQAGFLAGSAAARESSATLVEAVGCLCFEPDSSISAHHYGQRHESRCPIALARQIRESA